MPLPESSDIPAPHAHGHSALMPEADGIQVVVSRYEPRQRVARHLHAFPSLTIPVAGAVREEFQRRTVDLERGDAVLKPADAAHQNLYSQDSALCVLLIAPDGWPAEEVASDDGIRVVRSHRLLAIGALLSRSPTRRPNSSSLLATASLSAEAIALASSGPTSAPERRATPWLSAVRDEVYARCREIIGLRQIAKRAGVHPVHVSRSFHAVYGLTLSAFARRARVEWALVEMLRTDRPLVAIAHDAGFTDAAHLTHSVARELGCTPGRLRRDCLQLLVRVHEVERDTQKTAS